MSFTKRSVAVAIFLAAGCARMEEAPKTLTAADEAAINETLSNIQKTVNANDWDGWTKLFEAEGVVQPPNGKSAEGTANLVAWGKAMPPVENLTFSNTKIWGAGDIGVVTTDYVFKLKDIPADSGKQLGVVRRQADGRWLVAVVSFNSDLPPAPPPPPAKK